MSPDNLRGVAAVFEAAGFKPYGSVWVRGPQTIYLGWWVWHAADGGAVVASYPELRKAIEFLDRLMP